MIGSKNTGRKQAQRMFRATECNRCGGIQSLQRHHKDGNSLNNAPKNVEILCQPCHTKADMEAGRWGKGKTLTPKPCAICGKKFQPRKNRDKICKKAECLKELGRRSAELRWSSHTKEIACKNCGNIFTKERARQMTCSRSCGNILAWRKRRGGRLSLQTSRA